MLVGGEQVNLTVVRAELEEEQRTNVDLRQQLKLLAQGKDQTQASLAVCRHNLLQVTMKLEEEVRRVNSLEKLRLEDMLENSNLKKLLDSQQSKHP